MRDSLPCFVCNEYFWADEMEEIYIENEDRKYPICKKCGEKYERA